MNEIKYLDSTGTQSLISETKTRLATKQDIIQVDTMPIASEEVMGNVYQYIGANTQSYVSGYFYKCVSDGASSPTYSWTRINVQPSSGSGSGSIVKGYRRASNGKFYEEDTYTTLISGDENTIYIDIPTKYQYEYDSTAKVFNELGEKMPGVATEYEVGTTKPDNLTIFVNENGTIRTRIWSGTQEEYDLQKYKIPNDTTIIISDSIVVPESDTYVNGVKIVPWALGSDEDIVAMVQGHYDGKIDLYDYWNVGDKRIVHLTEQPSVRNKELGISESDQEITLISKEYGNNDIAFVVSFGNIYPNALLSVGDTAENRLSWSTIYGRRWCNNTLYNALSDTLRPIFKKFDYVCAESCNSENIITLNDYFAFFAEKELYGTGTYSKATEANALQQFDWFKTKEHRVLHSDIEVTEMPAADASTYDKTYYYTGETTAEFTHNKYYLCDLDDDGVYRWYLVTYVPYYTRSVYSVDEYSNVDYAAVNCNDDVVMLRNSRLSPAGYVPFGCI